VTIEENQERYGMVEIRKLMKTGSVEDCMDSEEKELCETLKKALKSKYNISRATLKHSFSFADSVVLLAQAKQSCMGCYSGDIEYIERCHHNPWCGNPCSLWEYRGGRVHNNTLPLTNEDDYHTEGTFNAEGRITEIFVYVLGQGKNKDKALKFSWTPRVKKSVTPGAAYHLARKFVEELHWKHSMLKRWKCLGEE
jgi:hypothetical protein